MHVTADVVTPGLRLRPLTVEDVPRVMQWAGDPEVVRNFSFFEKGADPERIRRYIDEKQRSRVDLLMAVLEQPGDRYAGNVGLHEWDAINDNARLGIILQQSAWGRGIAQQAICGLVNHAFTSMGLHKVYLNVFTTNDKGIHLYGKLGFTSEGVMRAEYKLRGGYRDMLRMSVLSTEWPTPAARGHLQTGGEP